MTDLWYMLLATLCGAVVGLEREFRRKPAGLRTNMLIALGAALFTIASLRIDATRGDAARIAAQIIPGVGFLGAGAILHHRHDTIVGLTSAATIWVVAALGMIAGAHYGLLAVAATALVVAILTGVDQLETLVDDKYDRCHLHLELRAGDGVGNRVMHELRRHRIHLESVGIQAEPPDKARLHAVYAATPAGRERMVERLRQIDGVLAVQDAAE